MSQSNDAPVEVKIPKLGADNYDKKVLVKGLVSSFTFSRFIMEKACFICKKCGSSNLINQDLEEELLVEPEVCNSGKCKGKRFDFDRNNSKLIDYQELYVQERQEDISAGRIPEIVRIKAFGNLTDKVKAGDRVEIIGILKMEREKSNSLVFVPYIEAQSILKLTKTPEDFEVNEEDKNKIEQLAKHPLIHQIIAQSIAPYIKERDLIKQGIMYSLFGGVTKEGITERKRGDIHTLFIGDPSTGRSELLKFVSRIAPLAIYTSGKGSSAVGLTAAVTQDKKGVYRVEGGALVRGDLGIVCIDEMDKMEKTDLQSIHTAMEQQILPIYKAGKAYTLNTRTTVIASGNPHFGYWDDYKEIDENIGLDSVLLTRFDLIFIVKDRPSENKDDIVIKSLLGLESNLDNNLPLLNEDELKKYVSYAKRVKPLLNENAKRILDDYSQELRRRFANEEKGATSFTYRHVQGLIRLTESHARISLKEIADEVDATAAVEIMNASLEQCGWTTPEDILKKQCLKTHKEQQDAILRLIEQSNIALNEGQIVDEMKKRNINPEQTRRMIQQLLESRQLTEEEVGFYRKV